MVSMKQCIVRFVLPAIFVLAAGCAPSAPSANTPAPTQGTTPTSPKRVTIMIKTEPTQLTPELTSSGGGVVMGTIELTELLHKGLSTLNADNVRVPQLATSVPRTDQGTWRVFPDGRMETSWKIVPGAAWHDGSPLTTDDLLFTLEVKRDRELPFATNALFDFVDAATVADAQSITVSWKSPYIHADFLFSQTVALPLPKHLLEEPYRAGDKNAFMALSYWNADFVGTGPFKLREWARGAYYLMVANDRYPLGRPKLDEVKAIFVSDPPIIASNLLAGAADINTSNLAMPLETALDLQNRWPDGRVNIDADHAFWVWPQFIDSIPPILSTSAQFRRALYYALDRKTMGESFNLDLRTELADVMAGPHDPLYAQLNAVVPHYGYDPRLAEQLMNDVGYRKQTDGLFHDASGEVLKSEMRTTTNVDTRVAQAIASEWQKFGMQMDFVLIPQQRTSDREYRATFPGFVYTGNTGTEAADRLAMHLIQQTPLPATNYVGLNTNRYRNPEFESLIQRMLVTIPDGERADLVGQAMKFWYDQVGVYTLWNQQEPQVLVRGSIKNVAGQSRTAYWNSQEWDLA